MLFASMGSIHFYCKLDRKVQEVLHLPPFVQHAKMHELNSIHIGICGQHILS